MWHLSSSAGYPVLEHSEYTLVEYRCFFCTHHHYHLQWWRIIHLSCCQLSPFSTAVPPHAGSRLTSLKQNQVLCMHVRVFPNSLPSLVMLLFCSCWLAHVHWFICDCWKSSSCQLSKHQLCRTEASVLQRGIIEFEQSFIDISPTLQTLVLHVLDSLYSCFSLSI